MATTTVQVRLFPGPMKKLTTSRGGPAGKYTRRKAEEIAQKAAGLVGKRYSGHHGGQKLARSISIRAIEPSPSYAVIATHRVAVLHHFGSRSHTIPLGGRPNKSRGGRRIVFMQRGAPDDFGPVYVPVRHPGTKPNPFLVKAARQSGLRVDNRGKGGRSLLSTETFTSNVRLPGSF